MAWAPVAMPGAQLSDPSAGCWVSTRPIRVGSRLRRRPTARRRGPGGECRAAAADHGRRAPASMPRALRSAPPGGREGRRPRASATPYLDTPRVRRRATSYQTARLELVDDAREVRRLAGRRLRHLAHFRGTFHVHGEERLGFDGRGAAPKPAGLPHHQVEEGPRQLVGGLRRRARGRADRSGDLRMTGIYQTS